MIPILNQHLKNDELDSEIEDEIKDEEYESSSNIENGFFSEIPTCAKVGLGVVSAGAIGLVLCKLFSNNENSK